MTDLPLAEEVATRNIESSPPVESSSTRFTVVDWDEDIPVDILRPEAGQYDLFMVADCTYNVDAAPALVKVLTAFMESSPQALLVLAHKKRHEAEQGFFQLMADLTVVDKTSVVIGTGDDIEEPGEVDLYTMRLTG